MFLLLFVIGLCVSGIRLEPTDVNFGPEQDINFSPTVLGSNGPSIWSVQPEANVGPIAIGELSNMEVSPTFSNNNLPKYWVQSPQVIAEAPYHGSMRNLELSTTFVKNNFPGMLVDNAKLSNMPMYIGTQKKIEIDTKHPGGWGHNRDMIGIPFYVESQKEIELSEVYLKDNLLSMSGTPYLTDPRRDFAEIINVIYGIAAKIGHQCSQISYEQSYQKFINKFAVDGISQPQIVVSDVKLGLAKFHQVTMPLLNLIKSVCPDRSNARYCDYMIHEMVVRQPERYQTASKVFFAGYKTAHEFNIKMREFSSVSKCHGAHKMIIEAPAVVKPIVYALADVMRIMVPLRTSC